MPAQNTAQNTTQEEGRARLSFDLEDETETSPEATHRKIEEISEKSGFTARAPRRAPTRAAAPAPAESDDSYQRPRRRRGKTGRTFPFNTKIKPQTYDKICDLADKASEREGRPISFAEIIERAIDSLEKS
jgi:hypothetical protein